MPLVRSCGNALVLPQVVWCLGDVAFCWKRDRKPRPGADLETRVMCSPGLEVEVEFAAPLALGGSVGDDDLDRTWSTGRAQEGVPLGRRTWYAA